MNIVIVRQRLDSGGNIALVRTASLRKDSHGYHFGRLRNPAEVVRPLSRSRPDDSTDMCTVLVDISSSFGGVIDGPINKCACILHVVEVWMWSGAGIDYADTD